MSSPERMCEPAVLTSWKEIASYLGKGVRTVQRWEKEDGLPIRRIAGSSKIVVQREELDRWLNSQPASNLGSQLSSEEFMKFKEAMQRSKQLREANLVLRASLQSAMHNLIGECQKMTDFFAARNGKVDELASKVH